MSKISDERLAAIVEGFTGLEFCADSDKLGPDETLAMAAELQSLRSPQPAGVRAKGADPTEAMIAAGLRVDFDNEHERATVINIWHAMYAALEPQQEEAVAEHSPDLADALRSLKSKLEAMPEELRGPFLVKGLAPYAHPTPAQKVQESQTVSEEWERVALAQSRKLQAVLHIPGVKDALSELDWTDGDPLCGWSFVRTLSARVTEDMVEKAAKAIYEANDPWSAAILWPDIGSEKITAADYRTLARAGLVGALGEEAADV